MRIALDDFGTGHSSLTHLRDYPVDIIKVDCSFVQRLSEDKSIYAIVEGLAKLDPLLSMDIIAERIETATQLQLLREMGCHIGQGYLFSPPVSAQQAEIQTQIDEAVTKAREEMQQNIDSLTETNAVLQKSNETLTSEKETLTKEKATLTSEKNATAKELETVKADLATKNKYITDLENYIKQLEGQ